MRKCWGASAISLLLVASGCGGLSPAQKAAQERSRAHAHARAACRTEAAPLIAVVKSIAQETTTGAASTSLAVYIQEVGDAGSNAAAISIDAESGKVSLDCQSLVIHHLSAAVSDDARAASLWYHCQHTPKCSATNHTPTYAALAKLWGRAGVELATAESAFSKVGITPLGAAQDDVNALGAAARQANEIAGIEAQAAALAQRVAADKAAAAQRVAADKAARQQQLESTILLKVTSTSGEAFDITYDEGDNNIEQATSVPLPWRKMFPDPGAGFIQLIAQNAGGGSITCTIESAAGSVYDQHTSTGPYAIATCSYNEG